MARVNLSPSPLSQRKIPFTVQRISRRFGTSAHPFGSVTLVVGSSRKDINPSKTAGLIA